MCRTNLKLAGLTTAGYLLAVPVVLVVIDGWSGYDLARLLQWPVLVFAAVACAWPAWQGGRYPAIVPRGVMSAILGLASMSVALAPMPNMAMREVALIAGLLGLARLVACAPIRVEVVLRVALVAASTYAVLIAGLALAAALSGQVVSRRDLFVGYDNHRFYSHVLTVAIPLALAARWALAGALWRAMSSVALAVLGFLLFATGGRGSMLALGVAMAVLAWRLQREAWPIIRPMVVGLSVGFAAFLVVFVLPAESGASLSDYAASRLTSDQARLPLWRHAIEMALDSPWFGAGPMHFAHGLNAIAAAPHNLPLQIAAEWGLPMLALVSFFIALVLRRMWQRLGAQDGTTALGSALSIGFVAVLVDALVSGNFVVPVSQVWIAVLLGLFWSWLNPPIHSRETYGIDRPRSGTSARMFAFATLALLLWLGAQMLPEAAHIGDHLKAAREAFPTERYQPRFWSHGRF